MNLSIPEELFDSFCHITPIDRIAFSEAHQQAAVNSIRLNPYKPSEAFLNDTHVPWCKQGRYLQERPNFTADPLLHAGCYYVQEASSMFLEYALQQLVNFDETLITLDLCASPGGKSTLLSSLLNNDSILISNEVISSRASVLSENISKWGKMNTWVSNSDPKQFTPLKQLFDIVLVDAPCSGSGLFRKMPDFANEWNMNTVHLCSQRQQRILHDIANCVKENGLLIYMTCSFCEEENEDMVDYILGQFEMESCHLKIPAEWGIMETISEKEHGYGYRFFPHLLKGEGFFISCFRRKVLHDDSSDFDQSKRKKNQTDLTPLTPYLDISNKNGLMIQDQLVLIDSKYEPFLEFVGKYVKIIKKGILCGKVIRGELIPDHELAMFANRRKDIPSIELSYSDAIMYLQKEHIQIDSPSKGWFLVTYLGQSLGWIKNLGNRINNYYPANYRILNKNILSP